ncbi:MAG TPA: hypothetical protein VIL26_03440 [Clostridia bacterium]
MDFVFYTFEGSTTAPDGSDVENLQILGFEKADTYEIALKNLISKNDWIKEKGYDITQISWKAIIDNLLI